MSINGPCPIIWLYSKGIYIYLHIDESKSRSNSNKYAKQHIWDKNLHHSSGKKAWGIESLASQDRDLVAKCW
jgi:hypothetical protein